MEEINLKELWHYFISKIHLLFVITAVILLIGNIYLVFLKTPLYNSYTTLALVNDQNVNSSSISLIKNMVPTYRELIKSRSLLSKVVKNLNLNVSADSLAGQIDVISIDETLMIKISVNNKSANDAKRIADEVGEIFAEEAKEKYGLNSIMVIDAAKESTSPYNINVVKQNIIYLMVSVVLGLGTIFVMFYFDTSIKDTQIIEDKFNLTVLGTVPRVGEKNG